MRRAGLGALLLLATLGEGGGAAWALAVWHAGVLMLVAQAWHAPAGRAPRGALPAEVAWALAAFAALFAVGMIRAPYAYAALLSGLELAAAIGVLLLAAAEGPQWIAAARPWLLGGGAAQGALAAYQWLQGQRRPAGTFLNPNHLGLWCAMALLVVLGTSRRGPATGHRWRWPVEVAALAALALAVVLSGSRGAFLALGAGACYLAGAHWRELGRGRRALAGGLVLLVLAAGGARLWQRQGQADPFRWHRLQIWRASLGIFVEDPLWGSGPGQFALAAARFGFPDGEGPWRFDRRFGTPHSDALRLPCELGLPAALAACVALGLAARGLRRARKAAPEPGPIRAAGSALLAAGVQALFDDPSTWPAVYLLAAALAGAALSIPGGGAARTPRSLRAAALLGLVLLYAGLDLGSLAAWRAARELPRGRLDAAGRTRLDRALALNPLHPDPWQRLAAHLAGDGSDWNLDAYAAAREAAERAVRLSAADARMWRQLAEVETLAFRTLLHDAGTRDRAAAAYREAERRAPHDPFLCVDLAKLLVDGGDHDGARAAAERALALEPQAALPRLVLADALLAAGAPGAAARAGALLDEAAGLAARLTPAERSAYGHGLLAADPAVIARLRTEVLRLSR